jgi:bacillithiol biosynthesis cysteine-adding enzyme BshC
MGSEDADIDELNHIYLGGEKISWETKQKGAVGRMKIDKAFVSLIDRIEGELSVLPEGNSIIALLRRAYKEGISIQDATFYFVNELFSDYGLIVLIADHPTLKSLMLPVFSEELFDQSSVSIVDKSGEGLESAGYKVQAHAREINLFYLKDDIRERITRKGDSFAVTNTNIGFSESALRDELSKHPDRFSPNVILRGLYQETILPNIAFIGGGGELAYWLQLKSLFDHYKVPFPVLLLRNSFMVLETKHISVMEKLGLPTADIFLPADEMIQRFVLGKGKQEASLNGSIEKLEELYAHFKEQAGSIDSTLATHVEALKKSVLYRLHELEKKMWKAEKRKYSDEQRQVKRIKSQLFPSNGLQERTANLSYYYAKWGRDFLNEIYLHSPTLEQEFVILSTLTGD